MRPRSPGPAALPVLAVCLAACSPAEAGAPAPPRRALTIFAISDLHSHLLPERLTLSALDAARGLGREGETTQVGGVARLATLLADERRLRERSLLLDAGDLLEGSAFYPRFGGVPEHRAADALGVDAAALGNHDTSAGAAALARVRAEWARFPLLGANLAGELPELVEPAAVIERGGVRVAVIGLGRSGEAPPALAPCRRAVGEVVAALAGEADVVVALSHLGRELDLALVPGTTGLDLVVGGHTHDVLEPPAVVDDCGPEVRARTGCTPRGVPVVHAGAYGRYAGRVDLVVSSDPADGPFPAGRRSVVVESRFTLLAANAAIVEDGAMSALLEPYRAELESGGISEPLAYAPAAVLRRASARGDSALGNFVADALAAGTGADLTVVGESSLRADLPSGTLTLDDLYRSLPFDDHPVALEPTGAELARAFEAAAEASCARGSAQVQIAGGRLELDCSAPGARARLSLNGLPSDPARRYRIVVTSFLAEPGRWFGDAGVYRVAVSPEPPPLRDRVAARLRSLPGCPEAPAGLPCLTAAAGATVDGRIVWK